MGLEPFNVASAVNLILAQRLLRRVCTTCVEQYMPSKEEFEAAKVSADMSLRDLRFSPLALENVKGRGTNLANPIIQNISLDTKFGDLGYFRGKGCDACGGTGTKGRAGVYEVMMMTPTLRKCIMQNLGAPELRDAAIDEGMLTLRMDAWLKVFKGHTNMEQMIRETAA
jgi:type IV pilus assembly protein PilB